IWPEAAWSAQCRDPHFTYNEDEGKWFLTFSAKKDDGEADPWDNPGCIGVLEWQGSGNDFASDWVLVSGQESLIVFDTNAVPEGQSITKIDDTWHMVWNFSATGMQHQSNTSGMWGPWETNPVDVGWADDVGYAPEITWVNGLSKWILSMHQASSKNYYMFRELDFDTLDVNGSPTITDLNTLDKCPGSWSITDLSGDDINNNHPSWSDDINISIQPVVYYNGRRYINMIDNNLNNTPVVSGLSVWMDQTRFGTPVQPYDLPWDSEVNYRYYTINEDLAPYSKSVLSLTSSGDNKPPTSTLTYGDSTISGYLTSETFTINNNRVSFYLSAPENDSDFFVALVDANTDKVRLLTTGSSNQSEGPQDDNGQQFYSDYSMVQKLWDTTSLMGQDVYVVIAKLGLGHFMLNYLQEYHETVTGNDPVAPEHPSLLSQAVIITSLLP
ncbi:hypothetical protein HN682_09575, partial [Candidatus Peregrinibacteria bacterium]|nr:hypothetical protein [Candidatus Peregrinibacteria bacterium]